MVVLGGWAFSCERGTLVGFSPNPDGCRTAEREFFIDNLLDRMHYVVEMILVDRPCAMVV